MTEHQCPKCGKKCHSQQGLEHHLLYCQPVQPSPPARKTKKFECSRCGMSLDSISHPIDECTEYLEAHQCVSEPVVSPAPVSKPVSESVKPDGIKFSRAGIHGLDALITSLEIEANHQHLALVEHEKLNLSKGKTPTSEEVILALQKSFEQSVKPALASWTKDVRIIRSRYK